MAPEMVCSVLYLAPCSKSKMHLCCAAAPQHNESGLSVRAMKPLESHKFPSAKALCTFLGPICGVKWDNLQCDVCLRTDVDKSNKTPPYFKCALMLFCATFNHRSQACFLFSVIHRQNSTARLKLYIQ